MDLRTNPCFTQSSDLETIAAISTPTGEGGIGLLRLSGPEAIPLACRHFRRYTGSPLVDPEPFRLYYGHFIAPDSARPLDEVLLATMRAPRSYTREDMAEISGHGGMVPLQAMLTALCASGARLARPGEFTQRAFLNGRLDLTQAEAVLDVIRARTNAGLRAAQGVLAGQLGELVGAVRTRLITVLAALEAAIDFADDDLIFLTPDAIAAELKHAVAMLERLVSSHTQGRILRDGALTVLIGRPNTGKSSLLNALLGEARAIVTPVPGTTRDLIEEQVEVGGVPIRLVDTAGIRETSDAVESLGVARSQAALARADLLVLVLDGAEPLSPEDRHLLAQIEARPALVVVNKADLPVVVTPAMLAACTPAPIILLSTQTGAGLDALTAALRAHLLGAGHAAESPTLATLRQREAAEDAVQSLRHALTTVTCGGSEELIAVDVMGALAALDRLTGADVRAEVLDRLFAQFCVGK
jgi:tRNA modification GTPase